MKRIMAYALAMLFSLSIATSAGAQTNDNIWLTASTTAYKTGETVVVTVNASSVTPIQGFTFQIQYDPTCLRPEKASSPIPGMNGLPLPQLTGLVDGSYASTTPQTVNGQLAEVKFTALKGCDTSLYLESAALAVRNAEGFAAPVSNVLIGERNVSLYIDKEVGVQQPAPAESGSVLPLVPPQATQRIPGWTMLMVTAILMIGLLMLGAYRLFQIGTAQQKRKKRKSVPALRKAALQMKRGPQAGKVIPINKLPCLIGRNAQNDICFNDPTMMDRHAKIFAKKGGYYLIDLSGTTVINGRQVMGGTVNIIPGDVIKLGKSVLFVFV